VRRKPNRTGTTLGQSPNPRASLGASLRSLAPYSFSSSGVARELSLPMDGNEFRSEILSSYRVRQGVLLQFGPHHRTDGKPMKRQDDGPRTQFLLGNVILALAALMLFFFGSLWEQFGVWALVAWMAMAVLGVYFISRSNDPSPPGPPN
jgi:hypothetical protein